jgi:thiamine kinase-like enzyme
MESLLHWQEPEREAILRPLLQHLASRHCLAEERWLAWQITPLAGGRNNLLCRATGPHGDLVIKFTTQDGRDRAGREYGALLALRQAGLSVAPEPMLLDRTRYARPVVVQTWLEGEVSAAAPTAVADWQSLLQHLAIVHTVAPENTRIRLPQATINASDAQEGKQRVWEQVAYLPREAQPTSLQALLRRLEAYPFPKWPHAPITLCRLDNNISNYVRRPGLWASVDWEYSGWGDPAFDVANVVAHVAYVQVPATQWEWVIDTYCSLVEDATAPLRIRVYCKILAVWWVGRLARYLYEIPRGLDRRLVTWSADWQADIQAKYEHYLCLADALFS